MGLVEINGTAFLEVDGAMAVKASTDIGGGGGHSDRGNVIGGDFLGFAIHGDGKLEHMGLAVHGRCVIGVNHDVGVVTKILDQAGLAGGNDIGGEGLDVGDVVVQGQTGFVN